MCSTWQCYDILVANSDTGSAPITHIFTTLISALNFLVTSCPALRSVSVQMHGVGVPASDSQWRFHSHHSLNGVAGMVVTVAVRGYRTSLG
jgi:hypothetical protein